MIVNATPCKSFASRVVWCVRLYVIMYIIAVSKLILFTFLYWKRRQSGRLAGFLLAGRLSVSFDGLSIAAGKAAALRLDLQSLAYCCDSTLKHCSQSVTQLKEKKS